MFKGFGPDLDTETASEKGAWMVVKDPFGSGKPILVDKKPVRLLIIGPDSQIAYEVASRMTDRFDRIRTKSDDGTVKSRKATVRILAETTAELTLDWENVQDDEGKPIPFDRGLVEDFYRRFPRIRAQVDEFAGNIANFKPPSAASSSPPSAADSDES